MHVLTRETWSNVYMQSSTANHVSKSVSQYRSLRNSTFQLNLNNNNVFITSDAILILFCIMYRKKCINIKHIILWCIGIAYIWMCLFYNKRDSIIVFVKLLWGTLLEDWIEFLIKLFITIYFPCCIILNQTYIQINYPKYSFIYAGSIHPSIHPSSEYM